MDFYRTSSDRLAGCLSGTELFRDLPSVALAEVASCAQVRTLEKNTTIFVQGARANRCHALIEGGVRITQFDENGGQLVVRFIGPGEMFGTVALFTDGAYPAEAVAVADSIEVSWTEACLLELIGQYPQISLNMLKVLGGRIKEVQERFRELATQRAECRVARVLLRLVAQAGHDERRGSTIDFPLTRKDIADMCGATLHTVSRVLAAWQKDGWIVTRRQRVTVVDPARLRVIADDLPN